MPGWTQTYTLALAYPFSPTSDVHAMPMRDVQVARAQVALTWHSLRQAWPGQVVLGAHD